MPNYYPQGYYPNGYANLNSTLYGYYPQQGYQQQVCQQPVQQAIVQPQNQVPQIPCMNVQSENMIRPSDVPSDGTFALFATSDGQAIYKKFVNKFGTIDTIIYRPETQELAPSQTDVNTAILQRLDKIEETLASWSK